MIKFTARRENGRQIIGIGISAVNVERLKEGKPIHVNLEEMGLPWKAEILLMYGETEQAMADELSEAGMIGPETLLHDEKRGKQ